jgi:hypothetical protein
MADGRFKALLQRLAVKVARARLADSAHDPRHKLGDVKGRLAAMG